MKTHDLRAEVRVPILHRGMLGSTDEWHHCMIEDMSTKGFLIITTIKLGVGVVLELKCELFPGQVLQCMVEVRHVSDDCVGTMIVKISDEGISLCRKFIDRHAKAKSSR